MKTWVDRGVYNAKKTVLFITKKFLQSQECTFQASLAVIRYIHTQGLHKHRVLLLLLESACTVPKYLQAFKCVYAWKYKTNPVKQLYRIYTEVNSGKSVSQDNYKGLTCIGFAFINLVFEKNIRIVSL